MKKIAIIIGAGPAGLTAAYELLSKTDISPIIIEKSNDIGGISKTINYKGNLIDIGGHRFFSKSKVVMDWWQNIMPIQHDHVINNDINTSNSVLLVRKRVSRIYYLHKLFNYPIRLNFDLISKLGLVNSLKIGISYFYIKLFPIKQETSLETFFINRFGKELYLNFFKDYTEKVWGVPCEKISPEWGSQRVKKLSVFKAIKHSVKTLFWSDKSTSQKNTETSLIEFFLYPKYGPGQMWKTVADIIVQKGGIIIKNANVNSIDVDNNQIVGVSYLLEENKMQESIKGDYFFSTMPVVELINSLKCYVPSDVVNVSNGLQYRDFITVGLLLDKLKINNAKDSNLIPDQWIYIQERGVKLGRLQIFNNWSPYMVNDPSMVWIGLEYFCNEGDDIWKKSDIDLIQFATEELHSIDIINKNDVIDSTVIRMSKTYPAYFGTYKQFEVLRNFVNTFENLFLIGRNGMHKYNNQDHSMLTAITAVENIIHHVKTKENIWSINTEEEYHES